MTSATPTSTTVDANANTAAGGAAGGNAGGALATEAGKLHATLSYVVPFFLILPLVKRENAFAFYHAKQALALWIAAVAASVVLTIVMMVNPIGFISTILSLAFSGAVLGMAIVGALAAWNGKQQPLPVIGAQGEKYLAGLKMA